MTENNLNILNDLKNFNQSFLKLITDLENNIKKPIIKLKIYEINKYKQL